jgi:hypothetical protein
MRKLVRRSDKIVAGAALLVAGIVFGFMSRQGEVNALKDMNRELLKGSEKKTWYLGRQFEKLKKIRA